MNVNQLEQYVEKDKDTGKPPAEFMATLEKNVVRTVMPDGRVHYSIGVAIIGKAKL